MYRRHSRNSRQQNRELEKAKEDIKETIEALHEHQSETENMIKRDKRT
jgi:hypothetical protein